MWRFFKKEEKKEEKKKDREITEGENDLFLSSFYFFAHIELQVTIYQHWNLLLLVMLILTLILVLPPPH